LDVTGECREVLEMYFKLILENGHVGAGKSLETVRYFRGESPADMFDIAARVPRVKGKNRGTGVKLVQSVSREEYIRGIQQAADDRYLNTRKRKKHTKRKKEVLFH
jgi:hypothetical protein